MSNSRQSNDMEGRSHLDYYLSNKLQVQVDKSNWWSEIWQRDKYEAEVFSDLVQTNEILTKTKFYEKVTEHLDKKSRNWGPS